MSTIGRSIHVTNRGKMSTLSTAELNLGPSDRSQVSGSRIGPTIKRLQDLIHPDPLFLSKWDVGNISGEPVYLYVFR